MRRLNFITIKIMRDGEDVNSIGVPKVTYPWFLSRENCLNDAGG